jgi:hypothetical protein
LQLGFGYEFEEKIEVHVAKIADTLWLRLPPSDSLSEILVFGPGALPSDDFGYMDYDHERTVGPDSFGCGLIQSAWAGTLSVAGARRWRPTSFSNWPTTQISEAVRGAHEGSVIEEPFSLHIFITQAGSILNAYTRARIDAAVASGNCTITSASAKSGRRSVQQQKAPFLFPSERLPFAWDSRSSVW